MPPKRKRVPPPPQPSPPPEPVASPTPPPASDDDDAAAADTTAGSHGSDATAHPPPTLFNTTFALYRASPLYLGPEPLTAARLRTLSQRLRDTLVGDVVRGVQVGLVGSGDDAALGRAGALETVDWRWTPLPKLLPRRRRRQQAKRRRRRDGSAELGSHVEDPEDEEEDDAAESGDDEDRNADARALSVELRYENSTFAACLLPRLYKNDDVEDEESAAASQWSSQGGDRNKTNLAADPKQFLHLPLLLLRMPAPLRAVLNDFLARTFDVRVRPLRLGTRSLVSSWAAWHSNSGVSGGNNSGRPGRGLVKDVVLSLGFHVIDESSSLAKDQPEGGKPQAADVAKSSGNKDGLADASVTTTKSLGLKAIDIIIPAQEVRRFIRAGEEEAAGRSKSKGKRKAGEPTSPNSSSKDPMSPSRRRKLAGGKDDEGWAWRHHPEEEGATLHKEPFTEALGAYLDRHLALDLFHPGVRIQRVACEGFVLSEGGRLKVFVPPPRTAAGRRGGSWTAWWRGQGVGTGDLWP
ncbi:hypothetical protein PG999_008646 [Apiospora kogelbergensis]|uniref:Uncharacterized protein n=1 Tax=Apiospora kogelbergensis TaxID=1337665 RepID=A0AAW0QH29_9PEZI